MNEMLSVIIPVYQAENFLDRCVKSVLASTYTNLEVILVDDGSKDNSSFLCDEWAQKDTRVKVIHKENYGVSSSRNAGIEASNGEFITFVDSDDYISETAYATSLSFFKDNVVCVEFNDSYCDANGLPYCDISKRGETLFFSSSISSLEHYWDNGINSAVWCRIFKTGILKKNNIRFDASSTIEEERAFVVKYFTSCEGTSVALNNCFYYYVNTVCGATKKVNSSQITSVINNFHSLIPICASVSPTCGDNAVLRYVETLQRLLRSAVLASSKSPEVISLIRTEISQYKKPYYASKAVSFKRKTFLKASLICPVITFKLGNRLKEQYMKQGKRV